MNRKKIKIVSIVGARPQFVKLAALSRVLSRYFNEIVLHTGQHYNDEMSDLFFRQLKIKKPLYNLGIKSGRQGEQTALMISGIEKVLFKEKPELVLVYGDTNSTLAGALAARKLNIPIGHIEAGLRSYNKKMSEEVNRIVTDHISDILFCSSKRGVENLKKEGMANNVYLVGDIMKDALLKFFLYVKRQSKIMRNLGLKSRGYFLLTIHRAENTDSYERLKALIEIIGGLDAEIIFPLHPRTGKKIKEFGITIPANVKPILPVGYFDMLALEQNAKIILTDSGGVQKEAFFLRTPCITLRDETEWVETLDAKMNIVTGVNRNNVLKAIHTFSDKDFHCCKLKDPYGDGHTADKIVNIIKRYFFLL
jgi:UDP-N-acetylglucosamine 2-epimerase